MSYIEMSRVGVFMVNLFYLDKPINKALQKKYIYKFLYLNDAKN